LRSECNRKAKKLWWILTLHQWRNTEQKSWTLNKGIATRLANFERKVLTKIFGGIKVNENWRKRHKEELMQLFGVSDTFSE
jgi:hypothetical protein